MNKLRALSVWEWLVCGVGMFFMGMGIGYLKMKVTNLGIIIFVVGFILEIPAFYLVFKHKEKNAD